MKSNEFKAKWAGVAIALSCFYVVADGYSVGEDGMVFDADYFFQFFSIVLPGSPSIFVGYVSA